MNATAPAGAPAEFQNVLHAIQKRIDIAGLIARQLYPKFKDPATRTRPTQSTNRSPATI